MGKRQRHEYRRSMPNQITPSRVALGWSPFHTSAEDYYAAGYMPIPLPPSEKFPPPKGTPNDIEYTDATLSNWLETHRPRNIGCIVPDGTVVFDVDGLIAQENLKELENQLGPLPATWMSFRGNPERYHLWFTVPNGLTWPGKLGDGIDIIYRHYRYMVLPPSIHPDGGQYRWANLKNNTLKVSNVYFPAPDEFTDLPEIWWRTLANGKGYVRRERAKIDGKLWLDEYGKGELCGQLRRVAIHHIKDLRKHVDSGGLHDAMVNGVWAIITEISLGHAGGFKALKRFKQEFIQLIDQVGRRKDGQAAQEWSRACIGAIEKTAVSAVRVGDPCVVEESERGKNPDRFFDPKHGLKARTLRRTVELTGRLAVGPGKIIYRHTDGVWVPDGESEIYRRTECLLRQRYRPSHATNVLSVVSNRVPLITDDKQDTQYLNLPNGLLDWQEGRLYPHNPSIVSTVRIPITWNEDAECPDITQFFREIFPNDAIELAYEILGYMLYNDNPLHKAILLHGTGRNGKSTFIRLARMLVGHNNISAITPQGLDSSPFASAQLYGKLANLVGDVDPRIFKSTEQLKQLVGGDYTSAQHKYGQPFTFKCRALMIAAFNALPRTADTTEGFFSKWAVVPFNGFFPAGVARPDLINSLTSQSNLQGLLRYAVCGLQQVMQRGSFRMPPSVTTATARFKAEADPMRGFIDERIECVPAERANHVSRTDIYNTYTSWAALNGYHGMSAARFYESFAAAITDVSPHPFRVAEHQRVRGFYGVAITGA